MQSVVRKLPIAIIRQPSQRMQSGERTFVGREPIDIEKAFAQHAAYCAALKSCGFVVQVMEADDSLPDCAFVEDCAVVLPSAALICRLGAESRLPEVDAVAAEVSKFRQVLRVEPPAMIEGGDVVRLDGSILVGRSCRTNSAGIEALRRLAEPVGFTVTEYKVHGCLHLKTGCTYLPHGALLANRNWIDLPSDAEVHDVAEDEPWAANILLAGSTIIAAGNQPKTNRMLRDLGFEVIAVDISEFQKAEGGVTCLSILIDTN
jgi:dimethylargininase